MSTEDKGAYRQTDIETERVLTNWRMSFFICTLVTKKRNGWVVLCCVGLYSLFEHRIYSKRRLFAILSLVRNDQSNLGKSIVSPSFRSCSHAIYFLSLVYVDSKLEK